MSGYNFMVKGVTNSDHLSLIADNVEEVNSKAYGGEISNGHIWVMERKTWGATLKVEADFNNGLLTYTCS